MALNKVTGQVVLPTTDLTVGVLTVTNSVAIGGTLTYEDVTNIDSVGLITARQGISVTGGDVKIGSGVTLSVDGHSYHTGVITATKFVGDGSTLTNITSTTINNNANNRVITGSGTANTLEGEANLTFDGTTLTASTDIKVQGGSGDTTFILHRTNAAGSNDNSFGNVRFTDNNNNEVAGIRGCRESAVDDAYLQFLTRPTGGSITERLRIDSSGRLLVGATAKRNVLNQNGNSGGDSTTPYFYAEGTGDSKSLTIVSNNTNAWRGSVLGLARTRGTSVGDSTVIQDDDNIGQILFAAGDGTDIESNVATIRADVDGTPGANDTPGRLVFSTTADGAVVSTERLRIDSTGTSTFTGDVTLTNSNHVTQVLKAGGSTSDLQIQFKDSSGNVESAIFCASDSGDLRFKTGGTNERLRITSDGWIKYTGSTDADETNKLGRFLMPSHDTNEEDVQYLQMEQEGAFNQITIGGGSASYNSATDIVFRTSSAVDTVTGTKRWNIGGSGHLMPGANITYEIGSNSIRVNKTWSNYWIHRHGSSSGVAQNEQEAIFIHGGLHFFHDNVVCSSASFTHGFTSNRSYPTILVHQDGSGAAIHAEDGAITEASDYRIKDNVLPLESALDKVKTLRPISYTLKKSWKPSGKGEVYHGFIAHEVNQSLPDITGIVVGEKDAMAPELYSEQDRIDGNIPDGKEVGDLTGRTTNDMLIQSVDYGKLTPVLTAAIKELITKVSILESEVDRLKSS